MIGFTSSQRYYLCMSAAEMRKSYDGLSGLVRNCMAHARRHFEKALDNDRQRAASVLNLIKTLYAVEEQARTKNMDHEQRQALRQEKSTPILEQLHQWLKDNLPHTTPQSLICKAIAYSLKRWDKLSYYANDGKLEIDNNLIENAIRPIALGRKTICSPVLITAPSGVLWFIPSWHPAK